MRHIFSLHRRCFPCAGTFTFFLMCTAAFAQTSQITGAVRDSSGAGIPDAAIRLTREDTGTVAATTTNSVGMYTIPYLAPATYRVEATGPGLAPATANAVLRTGQTLQLDMELTVAAVTETVNVFDSVLLQKTSGAVNTVGDRTFAANLSLNSRSFNSLLLLTPGVVATSGGNSVNGSRENTNQYNVDGVSANFGAYNTATLAASAAGGYAPLSATGGSNTLLSTDALEEFQVQTSSYAPEYGRSAGGQIQLTTRSGSDQFHGTAFDYLRNNYLDANNWFNNRNRITQPVTRQNDFGGTIGGPILRRKTFFFFSYEGLRVAQPTTVNGFVPSLDLRRRAPAAMQFMLNAFPLPTGPAQANGLAPYISPFAQSNNVNATSVRIDHHFSERLSLFGRYLHAPSASKAPSSLSNLVTTTYGTDQGYAGLTWTASSHLTNDLRVGYGEASARADIEPLPANGAVIPSYSSFFANQNPANAVMTMSLSFGSGTILLWSKNADNKQRMINITDSVTYVKGNHTFKLGFDYRRLSPTRNAAPAAYQTTFTTLASVESGIASSQIVASRATSRLNFNQFAAYVGDTWRVANPLVLTYGLRWDVGPPPTFSEGPPLLAVTQVTDPGQMALAPVGTPLYRTDYRNFAPRFGFAYDIGGKQGLNTVLRGGVGLFWDIQNASIGNTLGSTPPSSASTVYANVAYPLPAAQQTPPPIALTPPFNSFQAFDPKLPTPYVWQYNLAVEQQLGQTQALSINYVGSNGHHLARQSALANISSNFLLQTLFNLNNARSNYNGLQVKFQRRLSHGLQFLSHYTWSKSLDDVSTENGTLWTVPVKGYRVEQDYGPSSFDVRHQFSFAATYTTSAGRLSGIPKFLLSGWLIDPVVRVQSALPVHIYYTTAISGVNLFLRPDRLADQPLYLYGSNYPGGRAFNPAAFATHTTPVTTFDTLRQGTMGRNSARAFNLAIADVSVGRRFSIRESLALEARMDVFNVFNHPNFGGPASVFNAAGFGVSQGTYNSSVSGFTSAIPLYQVGGPRSVQLSLKLVF